MGAVRIGVVAPGYPPAYLGGGPIRTVHALTRAAADRHELLILTSNRDLGEASRLDVPHDQWVQEESAEVYYATVDNPRTYWSAMRELKRRRPDVLYLNSYFSPRFSLVPRLLYRLRWWGPVHLILAPRGELSLGALQFKRRKKRAFLMLARLVRLDRTAIMHASSELEAAEIRQTIPATGSIVIRPNETDLPLSADAPQGTGRTTPRFVFISRLVPMKGLDVALRALFTVSEPLDLDVYGSEEDPTYVAECRALAQQLPPHVRVQFRGPLQPAAVRSAFRMYDAFVLPTHGENFGHVIAEALSASCPVLASDATPWSEVLEAGGGIVVSPTTVEPWARALNDYARRVRADSLSLRVAAGIAYESWRARQDGPTVFDLYVDRDRAKGG